MKKRNPAIEEKMKKNLSDLYKDHILYHEMLVIVERLIVG
jgi:hypothetical protein